MPFVELFLEDLHALLAILEEEEYDAEEMFEDVGEEAKEVDIEEEEEEGRV